MVRLITLVIFVVTPALTAVAFLTAGWLVALAVLTLLPAAAFAWVVMTLKADPEAAHTQLTSNRLTLQRKAGE